jgi:hypothetical protein
MLGDGLAVSTEELGSTGGEVCTVVGLGLVVVGSVWLPLSVHADNAATVNASAAHARSRVIPFTSTRLPARGGDKRPGSSRRFPAGSLTLCSMHPAASSAR